MGRAEMLDLGLFPVFNGGMTPSGYADQWNSSDAIIISEGGNSCGFVNYVTGKFWRGGHCYQVRSEIEPGFLFQMLKYHEPEIMSLRVGSGLPNIQRSSLYDLHVSLPKSTFERRRIASTLAVVDARLDALSALAAKQEAIKKSTLSLFRSFEKKWGTMKLCEVGHFLSGSGFPIAFQGEKSGDYPFCKVSDFNIPENTNAIVAANNYISGAVARQLGCKVVPEKAIVFAKIGAAISLERKRLVKTPCCIDNNMMAFVPERVNPEYCCQLLQQVRFQDLIEATALPSLSAKVVGNVTIPIPGLPEQRRIADSLAAIGKAVAETQTEREKFKSIKAGLMRHFFG